MPNITFELNVHQLEQAIEQLDTQQKIDLVRQLEKVTLRERWNELLKTIDARLKKYPLSKKEIDKEIAAARKSYYAKRSH